MYRFIQTVSNPAKSVIANGQTYFAIQTRRQELADNRNFQQLKEEEKRVSEKIFENTINS